MAKQAAKTAKVYFDHVDISGDINSTSLKFDTERPVVTTLADTGPRRLLGNFDHSGGHMGYLDSANDAFDEDAFTALLDADVTHYLTQAFVGLTEGEPAYFRQVKISSQPRSASIGGAQLLNIEEVGAGYASRGTILGTATVTGAGNRTGRNMGATAAGTRFGVLFLLVAFTGTNITMKLQESQDDAAGDAYADITGLTSGALTAAGFVFVSTTSATEAWKRLNIAGTITSATILVVAGTMAGT